MKQGGDMKYLTFDLERAIMLLECKDHGMTKSLRPEGYGLVKDPRKKSRCVGLHRLKYCEYNDVTLDSINGLVVRHSCDNPRCIERTHLILGSRADNNRDRADRKRSAKKVPSRQKLTAKQVEWIRDNYVKGSRTLGGVSLGKKFGVHHSTINYIIQGKLYEVSHV